MKHRLLRRASVGALALTLFAGTTAAIASDVDVTSVVDVVAPTGAVTLASGGSGDITIDLSVTGNQIGTATFEVYRDWALKNGVFVGSNPKEFTVSPRGGGDPATTFTTSGTVSVGASEASGSYSLVVGVFDITNTNSTGAKLEARLSGTYAVTVAAPTPGNSAPVIGVTAPTVAVNEGVEATNSGTWSDANAGDTVSLTASYGTVVKSGSNAGGTWSWSAIPGDGPIDTRTVTITANDGTTSTSTTFGLTVNNVAPSVSASITPIVDCRANAALVPSFSDPGLSDGDWEVDIDWGDGTSHTTFTTASQGIQASQTHAYTAPGNYSVSVTVEDKDEGAGNGGAGVTVRQAYATTFLSPFNGSSLSNLVTNTMKNGRVVPVKVTLTDKCTLSDVNDPTTEVTIGVRTATDATGATTDSVETYADAGQSSAGTKLFRWSTDGFWIYNLDSKGLGLTTGNTYRVDASVGGKPATVDTWALLQPVK